MFKLFKKHQPDPDNNGANGADGNNCAFSDSAQNAKPSLDAHALDQMYKDSKSNAPAKSSEDAEQSLAVYDRLGQTLVATLTASTLSGPEASACVAELLEHLRGPNGTCTHVVLDLQNVEYMDSACIGELVELLTRLQKVGGQIALVNADPNVEYLFKLTRLDRLFPICRDVMKAIEVVERAA